LEKRELPKIGEKIPIEQFFVSKTNMRVDDPFGESPEDKALVEHFKSTGIVQPFKARPEGEGYGVVVGRRRFLALKEAGVKELTVGQHVWMEDISDEEAMDASLKENLEEFHRAPDPVTRAKAIKAYMERLPLGIRGLAKVWGMPHSSLAEYLQVLDLNPEMQEAVQKRLVTFRDALATVRLGLEDEQQKKLAEKAEKEGAEAFKQELARAMTEKGKAKRGIPPDVYFVIRSIFDKRNEEELKYYEALQKLAQQNNMDVADYTKKVIIEHVKSAATD
jgi:ParB family chromosome partitioning protein